MNLLIQILLVTILSYFVWLVWNNKKYSDGRKNKNLPPGSLGLPFIGESLSMIRAMLGGVPERFFVERIKKYKSPLVFKTSLFGDPVIVLPGPAGNKFLFSNENKLVTLWVPEPTRQLIKKSLLTVHGDEALWLRKLMSRYIGPEAYTTRYGATMDTFTRRHVEIYWKGKKELKGYDTIKSYAFELACRLFMSLEEPNHVAKLDSLFRIFLKGSMDLPIDFPGTRFYKTKKAGSAILAEIIGMMKTRRVALKEGRASPTQDLLSHLLTSPDENGRFLTDEEIADNILLILFAGHDTTAITITLIMKRLAEHPDVYDKVLEEQMEILKARQPGESLKWEHVQSMKYSSNVISESLRITTPAIGAYREALVDIEYEGYVIPKGWKIFWCTMTHKDNAIFEDPTQFDPSRFEGTGPKPYTFVPFGGGPRMCLGKDFSRLQILVFLHNIVTEFRWDLLIPDEKIVYDPVPTPSEGLPIRLHPHQA